MQQLDTDLWTSDSPLRFLGLDIGARMTVVRLPDGKLLLHSPIAAKPPLVSEVQALGPVAYLVAPNRFHHLFVSEWQKAFPEAAVFVAPGLDKKRRDLKSAAVLSDAPETGWSDTVDQIVVRGFPLVNEVVFFHRPSATLIATDLAFNVQASSAPLTRFALGLVGTYGALAPTVLERVGVRDRKAFRESLERILDWPFERVIVSHGEVSEKGGREEFVRGYQWVLGK